MDVGQPTLPAGSATVSNGDRKAALMLHSLAEEDRGWLLGQLGDADRARLGALIAELASSGMALDRASVRELTSSLESRTTLELATAEAVHAALADEPDWLVAVVLGARAWRWREALLRLLGAERAARVRSLLARRREGAPAALAALLARLEKRVADAGEPLPAARPRFAWRRLMPWR